MALYRRNDDRKACYVIIHEEDGYNIFSETKE